jgi:flagellar biosynthetic protein FliR
VTLELSAGLLSGYLLALVRAVAWVMITPPFATRMVPVQVKVGFAAALALALGPRLAEHGVPLEVGPLVIAAVLQVAAGVALGFVALLLFSAFQAAGAMIDMASGLSMGSLFDPISGVQASVFGRFYQLLATTLLFAVDGHVLLVRGFLTSFEAAPLTSLDLTALSRVLTHDLGLFFLAAVEIAAPLLAALFLAEVALGLLARAAPQMNVFVVGMPLKILLTLGLAALALPLLPEAVTSLLRTGVDHGLRLVGT